jgi:hypothetical protein
MDPNAKQSEESPPAKLDEGKKPKKESPPPSVGRIVHVKHIGASRLRGEASCAAAVISGVNEDGTVNVHVFEDGPGGTTYAPSVPERGEHPKGHNGLVWFWPPRSGS